MVSCLPGMPKEEQASAGPGPPAGTVRPARMSPARKLRTWKCNSKDVIGSGKAMLFIAARSANDVPDWSLDLPGFRCTQPRLRRINSICSGVTIRLLPTTSLQAAAALTQLCTVGRLILILALTPGPSDHPLSFEQPVP